MRITKLLLIIYIIYFVVLVFCIATGRYISFFIIYVWLVLTGILVLALFREYKAKIKDKKRDIEFDKDVEGIFGIKDKMSDPEFVKAVEEFEIDSDIYWALYEKTSQLIDKTIELKQTEMAIYTGEFTDKCFSTP